MMRHRVIVSTTAPAAICREEYERALHRFRHVRMPIEQTPQYRMMIDRSFPRRVHVREAEFALSMRRNLFSLYEVDVRVNGRAMRFIIDTGAQISGIRAHAARALALPALKSGMEVGSVGSTREQRPAVRCDSLQLGGMCWENQPLIVLDQQQFSVRLLNVDLLRFDGILGWDLLRTMDFELDTIAGQMKVQKNRFRLDRPNLIPCSFPTLLLRETDGSVSLFGIDTGARQGWLGEGYIRRRGLQVLNSMRVVGFGVHGREEFETQIAKSVTLHLDRARITMEGCMSALVDILPDITYDGVLGNEVFAGRRIRFVNSAGMVLLT